MNKGVYGKGKSLDAEQTKKVLNVLENAKSGLDTLIEDLKNDI